MSEHVQNTPPAGHESHGKHEAASPFTPGEWQQMHKNDIRAGAAVIVLMTAIFGIGVVLYTVVAIVIAS